MKRPWNLINVPVYSVSSRNNGITNMNICTYVSAVSMEPKRYMVAVYHNTQTIENIQDRSVFVLQLLAESQYGLVRNFGQKSGKLFDKQGFINRKNQAKIAEKENPYAIVFWNNFEVLLNAVSLILLKPIEIIPAGDHDMYLCDVVSFENLNDSPILTLDVLRQKKLIRI
jgi:flavin reductase (DIM6/NTAB) family NADH-FMN oxidoreductase RutF